MSKAIATNDKNLSIFQQGSTLPAHLQSDSAGLGNENVSQDALATPRIKLLQSLSPECVKGKAEYVKGVEAGQFINTVTKTSYEELYVSNLAFKNEYVVFKKRKLNSNDFQGAHATYEAAVAHLEREGLNVSDYDIVETHNHLIAIINPETGAIETPAIMSMESTKLAVSKQWNSNILTHGPNIDRFAGVWKLSAVMKTNNQGSWFVPHVEFAGWSSPEMYDELKALYTTVAPSLERAA